MDEIRNYIKNAGFDGILPPIGIEPFAHQCETCSQSCASGCPNGCFTCVTCSMGNSTGGGGGGSNLVL